MLGCTARHIRSWMMAIFDDEKAAATTTNADNSFSHKNINHHLSKCIEHLLLTEQGNFLFPLTSIDKKVFIKNSAKSSKILSRIHLFVFTILAHCNIKRRYFKNLKNSSPCLIANSIKKKSSPVWNIPKGTIKDQMTTSNAVLHYAKATDSTTFSLKDKSPI